MRSETDADKARRFMEALGARVAGAGRVYIAGGISAVLIGWRKATVDIDLKLDPEPAGAFGAIAQLKEQLDVNVELAAPDEFVPPVPGWRERSRFIACHGSVEYFHFDFQTQALSKISRGHSQDLKDATEMVARGLVSKRELESVFELIAPALERYPALDPDTLRAKLDEFVRGLSNDEGTHDS
jgi:hypothetical protein